MECSADELGRAAIFFPVIGFLLGSILVAVNFFLEPFSTALSSVLLVALLALLTGGLHLDGLGDTFDGLGAGSDRERALSTAKDGLMATAVLTGVLIIAAVAIDQWIRKVSV